MNAADRTHQTLKLRDGRILGFAEWGVIGGKPLLLFGGSNSARFARHPDESILHELGVHLYTFDRPGMGLSTRQAGRSLLDWAADIRDFATQKHIARFAIIAASLGGPFGTACAYALPDLLTSVTLVSAVSPLDDPAVMASQSFPVRFNIFMGKHLPRLMALQLNTLRPMLKGNRPQALFRMIFKNLPTSDQFMIDHTALPEIFIQDIRESVRQGTVGAVDDLRACVGDWGFRLEDIRTKVYILQGEADPNVTPIMARYMAARIPGNETTFIPDAGHFLMFSHWQEIVTRCLVE